VFNKVKTKKVYMKIVEQVRDLIKEGRLKPGDKLPPEQVLAEEFGTSRPSVREALSALEILGITESRGGKGNFIKDNFNFPLYEQKFRELEEEESPFELLEARKVLETEIVGLAAKNATEEEIATIQESLSKMKGAMTNIPEIMEFDREFHINIARAAHNSLLFSMMIYLTDLLKEKLWINLKEKSWSIPGRPQKYFKEHNEIYNAIKNKDSKGARKRMYDHLAGVERDLLNE
jgi:GntR family transcriptional repressor for pyruvate dehydrogenase complex